MKQHQTFFRHSNEEGVIRIILTADNHLSAYSPKLSPTILEKRRRRLRMAFKQTIDAAIDRQVHFFIQAGDMFDTIEPRNLERGFVANELMRLQTAGIRTFAVSGNHDTPRQRTEHGGYAPQSIYHQLNGMHYFDSSDTLLPVQVEVEGLQLGIAGLCYHPGTVPGGDPLDHVEVDDPENVLMNADLGIVILHAAIEGHAFPGEMETFVRCSSLSRLDGVHVVLAGHVHAFDRFTIGDKAVVVCGATERMEFGQSEDKTGFVYLELARHRLLHAEHMPIKPQPRHVVTMRTTELWPPQQPNESMQLDRPLTSEREITDTSEAVISSLTERITQKLEPYCMEEAMVRLILEGPLTSEQYHLLDLRGIWLYGQQRAFSFEIDESRLFLKNEHFQDVIERGERIAPREILESVAQEWMEQSDTPAARAILTKTRQRVLERYDELAGQEVGS